MIADELTPRATKVDELAAFIRTYEMASGSGSWTLREFIAATLSNANRHPPSVALEMADRCIERLARELIERYGPT